MHILFVTQVIPYPPHGDVLQRAWPILGARLAGEYARVIEEAKR